MAKSRHDAETDRLGIVAFQKALDTERAMRVAAESRAARLEERLGVVRGALERLLEHHDATCLCLDHKAFGPCDLSEFRALAAALGEGTP